MKPTYATVQKEIQKEHSYVVDGFINGGRAYVPVGIYIRNKIFVGKWMGLYRGGA